MPRRPGPYPRLAGNIPPPGLRLDCVVCGAVILTGLSRKRVGAQPPRAGLCRDAEIEQPNLAAGVLHSRPGLMKPKSALAAFPISSSARVRNQTAAPESASGFPRRRSACRQPEESQGLPGDQAAACSCIHATLIQSAAANATECLNVFGIPRSAAKSRSLTVAAP